mgnify:CR=1 FL=1
MRKKIVGMLTTATLLTMALAGMYRLQKSVLWDRMVKRQ